MERAVEDESPVTQPYVKMLRFFLWPIGAWPVEKFGEKLPLPIWGHRQIWPYLTFIVIVGQFIFLISYYKTITFLLFGDVCITIFLSVMTMVRGSFPLFKNYGNIIHTFLKKFHLVNFKISGEYHNKIFLKCELYSNYLAKYMITSMLIGMFLFNLTPFYMNYRDGAFSENQDENVTLYFSVNYVFPGFDPKKHFILATVINYYLSFNCSVAVVAVDLMLFLMVFQIIAHILILRHNLENLTDTSNDPSVEETESSARTAFGLDCGAFGYEKNMAIKRKMCQCVQHHLMIVDFTDQMSGFFGLMLGFNYLGHLVACCLLLLECSQGDLDSMLRYSTLTVIIFSQLIQTSVIFEVVKSVSDELAASLYYSSWEQMDIPNQRSVSIILRRMQIPISVSACGMCDVGLQTMTKVLKTTVSYFTFLKTMA